jgi:SNW domain-containing protein 1
VKEQQDWKIPPCISNWKNAKVCIVFFITLFDRDDFFKGYTIPLDKRLAADGRGLQSTHINENFAKLAEALYTADLKVRFVW